MGDLLSFSVNPMIFFRHSSLNVSLETLCGMRVCVNV